MYYGGDAEKWITAANSIKKKAYLNMGDYSSYNSITDYITSSAEDFSSNGELMFLILILDLQFIDQIILIMELLISNQIGL
jgi:hypothetical protein